MKEIIKSKEIPRTWQEASISLIHKDALDLKDPKNYKLISLLNTVYKIFTKILAERLNVFLKDFIKEDQAGFLPGQQIKDNLRKLLDCIDYYNKKSGKKVALVFFRR